MLLLILKNILACESAESILANFSSFFEVLLCSENVNQAAQGIAEISTSVASTSVMTREISDEIEGVLDSSNTMQGESRMVLNRAAGLADLSAHLQELVGRFRF